MKGLTQKTPINLLVLHGSKGYLMKGIGTTKSFQILSLYSNSH